jgi:hypothetical protein
LTGSLDLDKASVSEAPGRPVASKVPSVVFRNVLLLILTFYLFYEARPCESGQVLLFFLELLFFDLSPGIPSLEDFQGRVL